MRSLAVALLCVLAFPASAQVAISWVWRTNAEFDIRVVNSSTGVVSRVDVALSDQAIDWLAGTAFTPANLTDNGDDVESRTASLTTPIAAGATMTARGDVDTRDAQSVTVTVHMAGGPHTATLNAANGWTATVGGAAVEEGSVVLTWTPPTQNTDDSPLVNLVGYRVYWGTTSRSYTNAQSILDPGITTYEVVNLPQGDWYFAVTATNSQATESAYSNEARATVGASTGPNPPTDVTWVPPSTVLRIHPDDRLVISAKKRPDRHAFDYEGEVPPGTECIETEGILIAGVPYYAVPSESVVWDGVLGHPDIVYGRCQ